MQTSTFCCSRTSGREAKNSFLLLISFALLWCSFPSFGAAPGRVTGSIQSEKGDAIAGISVRLEGTSYAAVTDADGRFDIKNVQAGSYTLVATGVGHEAKKQNIVLKDGQALELNYKLNTSTNELSEVVISTARRQAYSGINKIDVPLRDMPITTSTISAKTIEQRGIDDLGEAMKNTTGVRANNTYGGFQHFTIRGFSNFVLLVDGVRDERHNISTSAPNTNLANVESIEILKGPASVLFGHSALGGIINIVRKRPTAGFKADFSASYGSFNTRRIRAGAGGAISDKLRYRVDFGMSDTDGFRHSGSNTNNGYLALEYTPTDKDQFYLTIGANKDIYDTDAGIPVLEGSKAAPGMNVNTRYNDPQDFLKHTRYDFQLKYTRQLASNLKLSNQLSYYDDNIDYFSTEELTFTPGMDSLQRSFPFYFNHLTKPWQNQLELTWDFSTGPIEHKLLAGYSVSILDRKTYNGDVFGPALNATIPISNPILNQGYLTHNDLNYRATMENVHGIYVQDFIPFSDKLKGLAGLRYDIFNGTYYTDKVDNNRNVTEHGAESTISKSALTYRLGLVYQPVEPLSVYGSFSTYFKPARRVAPNGETFDPETGYQGEIGSRFELSRKWAANLAFYYMRKNNQLEALAGGIYRRIGSAESKGVELEVNGNLLPGLDVRAGYTFSKAEILPYSPGEATNALAGKTVAFAPKNLLNAWVNYEVQQGAVKGLSLSAGANYMDETFTNSSNSYVLPAYTVFDAALGYRIGKIGLRLNVNNLFNEKYFANAIFANQFSAGPTRNFLVTVRYSL
ncbi:TonB-dependent receptor [Dyadobacter fermentans]|uniref:TonB-dependent siderophore receptor n=1 Tax=Dyadobacter fermentans (strain ATCC 700827 / DSM 18053 / CIP 107007 / KCTC 52180 / NS114) TaxID=471854 RepID=C6VVR7_DYAFD|nr:TonB-dependent receptor [Dyadobacter fermentans]ACT91373.1 TonB-dependent siderophore receptor [Dyadobacter fermentans DSM 18053]